MEGVMGVKSHGGGGGGGGGMGAKNNKGWN